jgi:hypothetical protein
LNGQNGMQVSDQKWRSAKFDRSFVNRLLHAVEFVGLMFLVGSLLLPAAPLAASVLFLAQRGMTLRHRAFEGGPGIVMAWLLISAVVDLVVVFVSLVLWFQAIMPVMVARRADVMLVFQVSMEIAQGWILIRATMVVAGRFAKAYDDRLGQFEARVLRGKIKLVLERLVRLVQF